MTLKSSIFTENEWNILFVSSFLFFLSFTYLCIIYFAQILTAQQQHNNSVRSPVSGKTGYTVSTIVLIEPMNRIKRLMVESLLRVLVVECSNPARDLSKSSKWH